jgi:hypothetical protein
MTHNKKKGSPTTFARRINGSIAMYDHTPVMACEKYDGTNVGKGSDNVLYGRRTVISRTNDSFQKAPLATVRSVDAQPARTAILELLLDEQRVNVRDIVFYGELMLGHDKFRYRTRGIECGSWLCFGAKVVLTDECNDQLAVSRSICQHLRSCGFAITTGLTIFMCDKLRQVIGEWFASVAQVTTAASMTDLILGSHDIVQQLQQSHSEGVVVVADNGDFAVKWKSAAEEESQAGLLLRQVRQRLTDERSYFATNAFDDRHLAATDTLLSITNIATKAANANATKKAAVVKADPIAQYEAELHTALTSGLTKYDSPEVYFEQGDAAVSTLVNALLTEVRSDLIANARHLNIDTPDEIKKRESVANQYVRRTIGKQYGAFKATKSGSA